MKQEKLIKDSKAQTALEALVKDPIAIKHFQQKVSKRPGQGPKGKCWEWQGSLGSNGYGQLRYKDVLLYSNRVALALAKGVLGTKLSCHTCDNPKCCRPSHLFKGTHQDNCDDKIAKGREVISHGRRLFTDSEVAYLRKLHDKGLYNYTELGKQYGVTDRCISQIVRRIAYPQVR